MASTVPHDPQAILPEQRTVNPDRYCSLNTEGAIIEV